MLSTNYNVTRPNDNITNEWWHGRDVAGNGNGQIQDTSPAYLVGMGKSAENSIRTASIRLIQRRGSPGTFSSSAAYWSATISVLSPKSIIKSRYSDLLRAGRSRDRIPVGGEISAPIHTGPGAHPAPYTMGTGSFPGVKRPGRSVDYHPHLAPRLKKE